MFRRIAALACCFGASALAIEIQPPGMPLAHVRRIFVDQLGGGKTSDQMRDMLIAALQNSGLFVITENPEHADASLKGSSDDQVFAEEHQTSDSIGFHASDGSGSSSNTTFGTGSASHRTTGAGVTESESSHSKERRHEAAASVRLVDADGDVIWSTTQESNGGKFRGAMADVADKIAKRLLEETRKARCETDARSCTPLTAKPAPH
ncbi:MAG: hypothetical protein ABSB15_11120 [Bryobacteraceae bacterium]|jgi:hypothetical protein